jgi:hypothetical protein
MAPNSLCRTNGCRIDAAGYRRWRAIPFRVEITGPSPMRIPKACGTAAQSATQTPTTPKTLGQIGARQEVTVPIAISATNNDPAIIGTVAFRQRIACTLPDRDSTFTRRDRGTAAAGTRAVVDHSNSPAHRSQAAIASPSFQVSMFAPQVGHGSIPRAY